MAAQASVDGREVAWSPHPKQELALTAPVFELLFGGAKAGGKGAYLIACVIGLLHLAHRKWLATGQQQYICRVMVFRRNLEDLKDLIAKSQVLYPQVDRGATFHQNDKTWTFSSGATITFRHLDGPTDHMGYNGNEFIALLFDEVQQISYEAYSFLVAQVRTSDPDYRQALMVRSTANPGGHDWLISHFKIDEFPEGGRIFEKEVTLKSGKVFKATRVFIRAYMSDNPSVGEEYEGRLRAGMSADEIAMYLEGDFFRVAEAFFSIFIRPDLHFVKSQPIPATWEMGFGMDWGSSAPAALYVGAVDHEGCLWIIDEIHGPGETGRRFGEKMDALWKQQTWSAERKWKNGDFYGVIDKQAMDRYGSEATAAAGIVEWGFRLFAADKDRLAGCNQLKERLLLDRKGNPRMRVFKDKCPKLVRALSGIKSNAPEKPDEYDPRSEFAHACDGARFLAMRFPVHPQAITDRRDEEVARWDRLFAAQPKTTNPDHGGMSTGYGD